MLSGVLDHPFDQRPVAGVKRGQCLAAVGQLRIVAADLARARSSSGQSLSWPVLLS